MKRSRFLCCASASGEVHLRDPKTLNVEHTLPVHPGGIFDMEVSGNLLLTCGYGDRNGRIFKDTLIRVFDIRTLRPLPPVPFGPGPFGIKLHPLMSSVAAVVSQNGLFQFVEVGGMTPVPALHYNQVDLQGRSCTAFDISRSGEVVLLGDSQGFLHQCSDRQAYAMNTYSAPVEFASPMQVPGFDLDVATPLSAVGLPHYDELLFSAWPANQTYTVGQPPTPLDPEILANIKQKDFVGYAPNTGTNKRNQV